MQRVDPRWALVTGASSGLGVELAEALARRGHNLVLAARRRPAMEALAVRLRRSYRVEVEVEPVDLASPDGVASLEHRLDERRIEPDVLVNNAGFGLSGAFLDQRRDRLRSMLQVDVASLTELTHAFGARMAARRGGRVLLVASLAAYNPCPGLSAYAAAKAYVLSLGEALNVELAPDVGVTVLSPGLMDTEFNEVSGFRPSPAARWSVLATAEVARIGLDAMFAGKPSVVAGRLNRAMAFGTRITSRHLAARMALGMSRGPAADGPPRA